MVNNLINIGYTKQQFRLIAVLIYLGSDHGFGIEGAY
jgi:hypothetical protein